MRYWDASALAPILVREPSTPVLLAALAADEGIVTWWGTRVECASALRRREREGPLSVVGARRALDRLDELARTWSDTNLRSSW